MNVSSKYQSLISLHSKAINLIQLISISISSKKESYLNNNFKKMFSLFFAYYLKFKSGKIINKLHNKNNIKEMIIQQLETKWCFWCFGVNGGKILPSHWKKGNFDVQQCFTKE